MPSFHRVVNHWKYLRSQWTVVIAGFTVILMGVVVLGSLVRAGENALAYNYYANQQYGHGCSGGCRSNPSPSSTPCPWWNNSYHCRYQTTYAPSPTPCPWWNNSYACSRSSNQNLRTYESEGCQYRCRQPISHRCRQLQCSGDYTTGRIDLRPVDNIDNEETTAVPTDSVVGSQPMLYPDHTPAASVSSTASLSPTSVPINNVNNNNSSAVANVVVNAAAATTTSTAQKPTASSVTELPQTGPTDDILRLAGAGSLVVASTAFGASRRELLKTVLRK